MPESARANAVLSSDSIGAAEVLCTDLRRVLRCDWITPSLSEVPTSSGPGPQPQKTNQSGAANQNQGLESRPCALSASSQPLGTAAGRAGRNTERRDGRRVLGGLKVGKNTHTALIRDDRVSNPV